MDRSTLACVKLTASGLFGLHKDVTSTSVMSDDNVDNGDADWNHRIQQMEYSFCKILDKAKEEIRDEILELEKRMHSHEEQLKQGREASSNSRSYNTHEEQGEEGGVLT